MLRRSENVFLFFRDMLRRSKIVFLLFLDMLKYSQNVFLFFRDMLRRSENAFLIVSTFIQNFLVVPIFFSYSYVVFLHSLLFHFFRTMQSSTVFPSFFCLFSIISQPPGFSPFFSTCSSGWIARFFLPRTVRTSAPSIIRIFFLSPTFPVPGDRFSLVNLVSSIYHSPVQTFWRLILYIRIVPPGLVLFSVRSDGYARTTPQRRRDHSNVVPLHNTSITFISSLFEL